MSKKITNRLLVFSGGRGNKNLFFHMKNQTKDFDMATIEKLINERNAFRNEKNYQKSDQIRDELKSLGIEIEDTPDGTIWRRS